MSIRTRRAERAYTLTELVVVIAVAGLLATLALPEWELSGERRLDTVQLALQDAIDHARQLSYKSGEPFGVRFGTDGSGWFAVINAAGVPIEDPLTRDAYVVRLSDPGHPAGVALTLADFAGRPCCAFDEKGVLVEPGQLWIEHGDTVRQLELNTASYQLIDLAGSPGDSIFLTD